MAGKNSEEDIQLGDLVQVAEEVLAPEFDHFCIAGWTGTVIEIKGKKSSPKYYVEWDSPTLDAMPDEFITQCEEKQLYYKIACLNREEIKPFPSD